MSAPIDPSTAATLAIRVATPDDAPALARFAARVFEETFGPENTAADMASYLAAAFGEERQRGELEDANSRVLLAVSADSGEIAGYAHIRLGEAPASVDARRPVEVVRFYVDGKWKGRGLAGRLMRACLAQARDWGCDVAWLGVFQRNRRAIAFYAREGFRAVGTQTFVLGTDPQTDDVMALRL